MSPVPGVDDFFQQRVRDALGHPALHLALDDHRIDEAAGVLDHDKAFDTHRARLDVHLDDGQMAGVGERTHGS